MKIGTFNLHQYYELNRLNTLCKIADKIAILDLDIVGFQEVAEFEYDFSIEKATNTARLIHHILKARHGLDYYLSIDMFKYGFEYNKEGLALLSKHDFINESSILVSNTTDEHNFQKRKIQVNKINYKNQELTIVNGHYTWDNDTESFNQQFNRLLPSLKDEKCILMGDFNNEYNSENYHLVTKHFKDLVSEQNIEKPTFNYQGDVKRIDYIFSNLDVKLNEHNILFKDPMYSDHYFITVDFEILN